ncbi:PREDICTED: uncharacterized protein LOC107097876 [Cyprinodon variegatus]|uniref:uncharacterized protein LOC107097876 n=1 Tax=Cyprinodon variegatus TaxID=28743 RepID=UPI0007426F77|nr:PREDICTED: uncharacterized protein LOC107097876 [Cyprinodon variegatus]XP_015250695.1 PREDICTED: uncharacterized protein LOC107097876 [Cyprinodon variegatus]
MPSTMILKPKPAEVSKKNKPVRPTAACSRAGGQLQAPSVRKTRASSCSRGPHQRDKSQRGPTVSNTGAQECKLTCEKRVRSASLAPKPSGAKPAERSTGTEPGRRRASSSVRQADANPTLHSRGPTGGPAVKELRCSRSEGKKMIQSHKAFTVIPPDPKKRKEIQKKAEAELAALEELRLSRAVSYVSIDPSTVGGCMSLEEVRLKQQQEMMQARRKQKQMKKQMMEETSVLMR